PTIEDTYDTDIEVDGEHVELSLCNVSGLEEYGGICAMNYSDTHIIVLCFFIDSPGSLYNVKKQVCQHLQTSFHFVEGHSCPDIPIIFVGCKSDLRYDPETTERLSTRWNSKCLVTHEEAMAVSMKIGAMMYLECSSATGAGVREVFQNATRAALLR
ncbi:P-loop containing nucleoside triphosphate hydrolase protein, partial [Gymnopus androsaceus JB14]